MLIYRLLAAMQVLSPPPAQDALYAGSQGYSPGDVAAAAAQARGERTVRVPCRNLLSEERVQEAKRERFFKKQAERNEVVQQQKRGFLNARQLVDMYSKAGQAGGGEEGGGAKLSGRQGMGEATTWAEEEEEDEEADEERGRSAGSGSEKWLGKVGASWMTLTMADVMCVLMIT